MEALSVSESDLKELLDQEGGLDALKQSLKSRGAVTNTLVKQGIHFYVKDRTTSTMMMDDSTTDDSSRRRRTESCDDDQGAF